MTKKRVRSRRCICDNEKQCHGMSLAFQMLEDPRGGHAEVPPPTGDNPEYEFLHRMSALRQAYFRHLDPHSTMKHQDQDLQFVALHHFPPRLVRKLAGDDNNKNKRIQVPPSLRPSELRRLGWKPIEADRVYDVNGRPTEEYFCVPNYPIAAAHSDLKQLARAERSTQDISTSVYQNAKKAIEARKNGKQGSAGGISASAKTSGQQQANSIGHLQDGTRKADGQQLFRYYGQDGASTEAKGNTKDTKVTMTPIERALSAAKPITEEPISTVNSQHEPSVAIRPTTIQMRLINMPKETNRSANNKHPDPLGDSNATCVLDESEQTQNASMPSRARLDESDKTHFASNTAKNSRLMDTSEKTQATSNTTTMRASPSFLDISNSSPTGTLDALDAFGDAVYGSYFTRADSEHNKMKPNKGKANKAKKSEPGETITTAPLTDSSHHPQSLLGNSSHHATNKFDASEVSMQLIGKSMISGSSHHSENSGQRLYASEVSMQLSSLIQASGHNEKQASSTSFHESDVTEKASGTGPATIVLHASDITIPASNMAQGAEEEQQINNESSGNFSAMDASESTVYGSYGAMPNGPATSGLNLSGKIVYGSVEVNPSTLDAPEKTVYGSYFARSDSESNRPKMANLGKPNPALLLNDSSHHAHLILGNSSHRTNNKFHASEVPMQLAGKSLLGGSSHHSDNSNEKLYASEVSMQLSSLMPASAHTLDATKKQASSTSYQESDITEKAPGTGPSTKVLHALDTTTTAHPMAQVLEEEEDKNESTGNFSALDASESTVYGSYGAMPSRAATSGLNMSGKIVYGSPEVSASTLDVPKGSVYGSYFARSDSETNRPKKSNMGNSKTTLLLGDSSHHPQSILGNSSHHTNDKCYASEVSMQFTGKSLLGGSSHHSENSNQKLYASEVSMQLSSLMQASGTSLHESDITEKASDTGPTTKVLHASDITVPMSNMVHVIEEGEESNNESSGGLSALYASESTVYGSYGAMPSRADTSALDISGKTVLGSLGGTTNTLDAPKKSVYGSYYTKSALETSSNRSSESKQQDPGNTNTSVGLGSSSHHHNLHTSAVSLQITNPSLMEKSGISLHASDITVPASGKGPSNKMLHASDITVPASNNTRENEQQSGILSKVGTLTAKEVMEGGRGGEVSVTAKQVMERGHPPSLRPPPAIKLKVLPSKFSQLDMDFPLDVEPRRPSNLLPSCELPSEMTPRKATRLRTSIVNVDSPASPTGISRFRSSPNVKVNDSSPMTPRRMVSASSLQSDDGNEEQVLHTQPSQDEVENSEQIIKSSDCAPCNPKRKQSFSELDLEEAQVDIASTSNAAACNRMDAVKECGSENSKDEELKHQSIRATKKEARRMLGGSDPEAPPLRKGVSSQLALLQNRAKKFHGLPQRSTSGVLQRRILPARSWSDDSNCRRVGEMIGTPERSKSDLSTKLRRSSDTALFRRRGSNDHSQRSASGSRSLVRSVLGATRCIDTTFRAMQQFCNGTSFQAMKDCSEDYRHEEGHSDRRLPRPVRSGTGMAGNEAPSGNVRRGRRGAVVASNGDELVNSSRRRGERSPPPRSKSFESEDFPKRSSHPSPTRSRSGSRSLSPKRGVRRTKSVDVSLNPERISRRTRIQQRNGSNRSRLSPSRTKSGLSIGNRNIRRLDTTKRAMKQFVNDTGTGSELSADRSPRRLLRRTRTAGTNSSTPSRHRSPMRITSRLNDRSHSDLTSSSPASREKEEETIKNHFKNAMSAPSPCLTKTNRLSDRSHSDLMSSGPATEEEKEGEMIKQRFKDAMSASSPCVMTETAGLRKRGSNAYPKKEIDNEEASRNSSNASHGRPSGHCATDKKSTSSGNDFADCAASIKADAPSQEHDAAVETRLSVTLRDRKQHNTSDAAPAAQESALSDSLHEGDFHQCNANLKSRNDSLNLEDFQEKTTNKTPSMLPDFHFSYPLSTKPENRKDVDWESIGFYSSCTAISRAAGIIEEPEREPTTFGLPWRLVGKKARQQLLTEVVLSAHRRQGAVAKQQEALKSARRRQSQMVVKEMLASVRQKEEHKRCFGEEVAEAAEALFEGDRAGRKESIRRKSMEKTQTPSLVSLSLDSVFQASQDLTLQNSCALNESSTSLGLRRDFECKQLSKSESDVTSTSPGIKESEMSGSWGSQQLRAVFPFKTMRERKKVSPLPERPQSQLSSERFVSSPRRPARRLLVAESAKVALAASNEQYVEPLPDISEEEPELGKSSEEENKGQGSLPSLTTLTHGEEGDEVANTGQESLPSLESIRPSTTNGHESLPSLESIRPSAGINEHESLTSLEQRQPACKNGHESLPSLEPMPPSNLTEAEKSLALSQQHAKELPPLELAPSCCSSKDQSWKLCSTLPSEQEESNAAATESATAPSPVPRDMRAKMAALLHEDKKEHDLFVSTPTAHDVCSLPESKQSCFATGSDGAAELTQCSTPLSKASTLVEFPLAFPDALALVHRTLPPSTDVCLDSTKATRPYSPHRGQNRQSAYSNDTGLDNKIKMDFPHKEIKFIPSSYDEEDYKNLNESKSRRGRQGQGTGRRSNVQ